MEEIVIGHGEWDGDVKEDKGKWRLDLKGKGDFSIYFVLCQRFPRENSSFDLVCFTLFKQI